jgi:hypothetical protein
MLKRDATLRPMEIKEPPKKGADHIAEDIVPDRTEQYMDLVPKNTSPLKEKVTPPEGDIEARDKQATSTLETLTALETMDARDECVQEYISGLVHQTPPRRTTGPQTRNRKIRDTANHWDPITVSDIEETPQKSAAPLSAGRPARTRRSTNRPWTAQPELTGEPRCDPRHKSRRDASATATTLTAPGGISD